jgi:hypothetical protein
LNALLGDWVIESEAMMEPGKPPIKITGTESVRSLGGLWVLCEGGGEMPGGGTAVNIMTLGYDPARKRYVGTFVSSMMTHLWLYDGSVDAAGKILTLDAEGPGMTSEGKMAKYKDTIEIVNGDYRILRSQILLPDGTWFAFMSANYRRRK